VHTVEFGLHKFMVMCGERFLAPEPRWARGHSVARKSRRCALGDYCTAGFSSYWMLDATPYGVLLCVDLGR
jgi:hypothetical protein